MTTSDETLKGATGEMTFLQTFEPSGKTILEILPGNIHTVLHAELMEFQRANAYFAKYRVEKGKEPSKEVSDRIFLRSKLFEMIMDAELENIYGKKTDVDEELTQIIHTPARFGFGNRYPKNPDRIVLFHDTDTQQVIVSEIVEAKMNPREIESIKSQFARTGFRLGLEEYVNLLGKAHADVLDNMGLVALAERRRACGDRPFLIFAEKLVQTLYIPKDAMTNLSDDELDQLKNAGVSRIIESSYTRHEITDAIDEILEAD